MKNYEKLFNEGMDSEEVKGFVKYIKNSNKKVLIFVIDSLAHNEKNTEFYFNALDQSMVYVNILNMFKDHGVLEQTDAIYLVANKFDAIKDSKYLFSDKNEFLILQYPKQTLLAMKKDNLIKLWSNEKEVADNYVIKNYLQANFGKIDTVSSIQNVMKIDQTKLLIIDEKSVFTIPIRPDIVLLTQSPKINLERLITELQPKIIVADGSNFKTLIEQWQKTCAKKNIPFHSTSEKGYYKIELP